MLFSKIELHRDTEAVAHLARQMDRDGYRLHQSLWNLFKGDEQRTRDFLYRRVEDRGWPCFYVVSVRPPEDTIGIWTLQIKDYTPKLNPAELLAFSLRANPVITRPAGQGAKPTRHDVVMDAKKHQQDTNLLSSTELAQKTGERWLGLRAEKHGFRIEQVRIDSYRQHRLSRARSDRPIRFSTLDFNGVLAVTDPERLLQTLYHGIGPAKGFGCGLMLVRRMRSNVCSVNHLLDKDGT